MVKPLSLSEPMVTVPPAGQPGMASMAALMPAVLKLLPRTTGTESAPASRSWNCRPLTLKLRSAACCSSLSESSAALVCVKISSKLRCEK
jgi:hypothetical protein